MIYVDGASVTYGDELDRPDLDSWPAQLSKILNTPVLNNAQRGKSNERMIFDTINFCVSNRPSMVIIAFGPISRKFFTRRENNFPIDVGISGQNSLYEKNKEFKDFQKLLFKYWSNYLYDVWKFLQQVVTLQSFLKQQHIPYLLINTVNFDSVLDLLSITSQSTDVKNKLLDAFETMNDNQIVEVEMQLKNLYNAIDHKNYYRFDWHFQQLVNYKYHPTASQHQEIAEFISRLITNDSH